MSAIVCENLYKQYRDKQVLNGFDFQCENSIMFLAGRNGAGKTTFIKIAFGMEKPDKGHVRFVRDYSTKKHDIGVVFDTPCLYPHMSCQDNINIFCTGFLDDKAYVKTVLNNLHIDNELLHKSAGKCSFGQQHRISVAIALIRKPSFLFLDEPTIGLDPISWELVRNSIIKNKEEQNGCVVITGQDYFEMASFSNELVILDAGISKYTGSTKAFLESFPSELSVTMYAPIIKEIADKSKTIINNADGTVTCFFRQMSAVTRF